LKCFERDFKGKLFQKFSLNSIKAPPAAKEKLLKKFLFGFSSKRFTGRRERRALRGTPDDPCKIIYEKMAMSHPIRATRRVAPMSSQSQPPKQNRIVWERGLGNNPFQRVFPNRRRRLRRFYFFFSLTFHMSAAERWRECARSAARIEMF